MNAEEMKRRSRGISHDMSPQAIARRIDIVSRLRALTRQLGKAERADKERGVRQPEPSAESASPDSEAERHRDQ